MEKMRKREEKSGRFLVFPVFLLFLSPSSITFLTSSFAAGTLFNLFFLGENTSSYSCEGILGEILELESYFQRLRWTSAIHPSQKLWLHFLQVFRALLSHPC